MKALACTALLLGISSVAHAAPPSYLPSAFDHSIRSLDRVDTRRMPPASHWQVDPCWAAMLSTSARSSV